MEFLNYIDTSDSDDCAEDVCKSVTSVDGNAEAVVEDTPIDVVEAEMKERHRHIFNLRMFPSLFEGPKNCEKMKPVNDHPKPSMTSFEMNQAQWEEAINIVRHFGPQKLKDANEEQARFRKSLSKVTVRRWTKLVNCVPLIEKYKVEEFKMPGSDQIQYRLFRKYQRKHWHEEKWLLCVPQLHIFDAIHECHNMISHMKLSPTLKKVHEKYYNISEKQVSAFIETCFECNMQSQSQDRAKRLKSSDSIEQNTSKTSTYEFALLCSRSCV